MRVNETNQIGLSYLNVREMKEEQDEELFDEKNLHDLDSIDPTDIGGLDHDSKVIDLDDLDLDLFPEE